MTDATCLVVFHYQGVALCNRLVQFPFTPTELATKFKRLLRAHHNLVVEVGDIQHRIVIRCTTEIGELEVDPDEVLSRSSLPAGTTKVTAVLAQLIGNENSSDGSDSRTSYENEPSGSAVEASTPIFVLESEHFQEERETLSPQPLLETFSENDDATEQTVGPWAQWLAEKGISAEEHRRQIEEELGVSWSSLRITDEDVIGLQLADVDSALHRAAPEELLCIEANFNYRTLTNPERLKDYLKAFNRVLQRWAEQLAHACKKAFYPERREYAQMAYNIWRRWPHVADVTFLLPYGSVYNWKHDGPLYIKVCHYRRSNAEGKSLIRARTNVGGNSTKKKKVKTNTAPRTEPNIDPAVGRIRQMELAKLRLDAANLIVNAERMDAEYYSLRDFRRHDIDINGLTAQQIVDNWPMVLHRPQCMRSDFVAYAGCQALTEDQFVRAGQLLGRYLSRVVLSSGNRTVTKCLDVCETFKISTTNEYDLLDPNTQAHFAIFALAALIGRGKRGCLYNMGTTVAKLVHFEPLTPQYMEHTTAQRLLETESVKQPIVIALTEGGTPSEKVVKYQLCACGITIDSHAIDFHAWRAIFRALCTHCFFNLSYSDEAHNVYLLIEKLASNSNTGPALPACVAKIWGPFKTFAGNDWSEVESIDQPNLDVVND